MALYISVIQKISLKFMATLKELLDLNPGRKIIVSFSEHHTISMHFGDVDVFKKDQLEFDFMGPDDVYVCIHDLYEDHHVVCKPFDVEILPEREIMYV